MRLSQFGPEVLEVNRLRDAELDVLHKALKLHDESNGVRNNPIMFHVSEKMQD
jgi:hypothetical protein